MPPLFTSTSWTTLVRKVASAARQVHPALPAAARTHAPGPSQGSLRSSVRKAQLAIRNAIRQSFPSLGTPSHQLGYALQPIHISRGAPRAGPSSYRYGSTMAFRTAYRLPRHVPSAAHMTGQVGLGSARTFASGPASTVYATNVPLGFRALVQLIDRDEEYGRSLPRPRRYRPYTRDRCVRHMRKSKSIAWTHSIDSRSVASFETPEGSIDSTLLSAVSHYFPFRSRTSAFVPVPICPEELVKPGKTTTLSLPLSPDLHALLDPTPLMSYAQAEVGSKVMSDLCQGLLTMEEAFDMYRQACVHPMLAHLEALDVLRLVDTRSARVEGLVLRDAEGRPDVLRLVFYGRSMDDVRKILSTTLKPNEKGDDWWTMYEANQTEQALDAKESAAILEDWSDQPAPKAELPAVPMMDQSVVDLLLPTLNVGQNLTPALEETWSGSERSSPASSILPTPAYDSDSPYSLPSHGFSTPTSEDSFPASLTASLLSSLNESTSSSWHIRPSEDDIEVESMVSFSSSEPSGGEASEVWTEADVQEVSRPPSPSSFARWSGTGQGFGVMQPW